MVSDLFCPARILVCRHAEATYERSDLILDDDGWLTERGRAQARDLGARLAPERVAVVFTSTLGRARETGELVGAALGVPVRAIAGVQEFSVGRFAGRPTSDHCVDEVFAAWSRGDLSIGCPGAETGAEVVSRFAEALETLAEQHRGETVVVISHGGVMSLAMPNLSTNATSGLARNALLPHCAHVPVEIDADGWRLVGPWPGLPVG
jgi:broad specificity phosphatase PhoE